MPAGPLALPRWTRGLTQAENIRQLGTLLYISIGEIL
jgi:hypothetical protein